MPGFNPRKFDAKRLTVSDSDDDSDTESERRSTRRANKPAPAEPAAAEDMPAQPVAPPSEAADVEAKNDVAAVQSAPSSRAPDPPQTDDAENVAAPSSESENHASVDEATPAADSAPSGAADEPNSTAEDAPQPQAADAQNDKTEPNTDPSDGDAARGSDAADEEDKKDEVEEDDDKGEEEEEEEDAAEGEEEEDETDAAAWDMLAPLVERDASVSNTASPSARPAAPEAAAPREMPSSVVDEDESAPAGDEAEVKQAPVTPRGPARDSARRPAADGTSPMPAHPQTHEHEPAEGGAASHDQDAPATAPAAAAQRSGAATRDASRATSRRSSVASHGTRARKFALNTMATSADPTNRFWQPSYWADRKLRAEQRERALRRKHLEDSAADLTFQPKAYENPQIAAHAMYEKRGLQGRDPAWQAREQARRELEAERDYEMMQAMRPKPRVVDTGKRTADYFYSHTTESHNPKWREAQELRKARALEQEEQEARESERRRVSHRRSVEHGSSSRRRTVDELCRPLQAHDEAWQRENDEAARRRRSTPVKTAGDYEYTAPTHKNMHTDPAAHHAPFRA